MSDALKKAAEELDQIVTEEGASYLERLAKALRDPKSLLIKGGVPAEEVGKSMDKGASDKGMDKGSYDKGMDEHKGPRASGELIVSGKKKKVKDDDDDGQDGHEDAQGGDEKAKDAQASKSAAAEEYEILDGEKLAKALTEIRASIDEAKAQIAKSQAADARMEKLERMVESLAENVGTVLGALSKSQAVLHKSIEGIPRTTPTPGVMGKVGARDEVVESGKKSNLTKRKAQMKIEDAISKGDLDRSAGARALMLLDSRGVDGALAVISPEIAKSIGLTE